MTVIFFKNLFSSPSPVFTLFFFFFPIMTITLTNNKGKPPYWQDFVGIVCLLVINSTINFIQENNVGNDAVALMAGLAPKTKVLRNGKWSEEEETILVSGDIISTKLRDIVLVDARLLKGDPLKIDQSALTRESLPVTKNPRDVRLLGFNLQAGKATYPVDSTNQVGHFQKVLNAIGNFCIYSIVVGPFQFSFVR
ncbi:hypothetical protein GQ457_13G019320 [Hibiscus cannabinus]